jgi:hypothetical protein
VPIRIGVRVENAGERGKRAVAHRLKWQPEMMTTRKRYRVLVLAALAAAVVVPLGSALSLEPAAPVTAVVAPATNGVVAAAATSIQSGYLSESVRQRTVPRVPDGFKLLFVGSALFGVAGVMRRSH